MWCEEFVSAGVSAGVGGASEYGMGEWWVGNGLIRMNM